ncbi:hypothetical protein [Nonomuraea endophytica]|uniref:hypothetical protein n=1 Tax=Nonomuraea endophytica TaxID=714136 RepID=UPI0037CC2EE9
MPLDANQRAGTRVNVNTLLISGSADQAQVRAEAVKVVSAAIKGSDSAKLITVAGVTEARAARLSQAPLLRPAPHAGVVQMASSTCATPAGSGVVSGVFGPGSGRGGGSIWWMVD